MRNWSMPLGRVAGIPLEAHASFALLPAAAGWHGWISAGPAGAAAGLLLVLAIFGCIVLHELGHALAARRWGVRTSRILLLPFGGMAELSTLPRDPGSEVAITLAGPLVNFALAGIGTLTVGLDFSRLWQGVPLDPLAGLQSLTVLNLLMGCFNLLPIFPMDGGRLLRAGLSLHLSYIGATRVAAHAGKVLALGCIAAAMWFREPYLVLLFGFVAIGGDLEYRSLRRSDELAGLCVGDLARRRFLHLPADATISDALDLIIRHRPQDILLVRDKRPEAVLSLERLRQAARPGSMLDAAANSATRIATQLQADWPLEPFYRTIRSAPHPLIPVYARERFVGVIESRSIDESLAWARRTRRARGGL